MPQMQQDALRALLGMKSPSNMTTTDPYLSRRRNDIISGVDDFVPYADSAGHKVAQIELGNRGIGVSRDAIREDQMGAVRQALGMGAVKHGQELERSAVAPQVAGEYGLRRQVLANEGAVDSARAQAEVYTGRLRQSDELIRGRQDINADRVDARQQQNAPPPTQGQTKALSDARSSYGRPMNRLGRQYLGTDGGKTDYLTALNDVLVRSGSYEWISQMAREAGAAGYTAAQAIAEAESQGAQLDPYEQEFLKLMLGE